MEKVEIEVSQQIKKRGPYKEREESGKLLEGVIRFLKEEGKCTIRHLYYRCCAAKFFPKTKASYEGLDRKLSRWRRQKKIPYDAFFDTSRQTFGINCHKDISVFLDAVKNSYCRDIWAGQPLKVIIVSEKDTVIPALIEAANEYFVKVYSMKGSASCTSIYEIAEMIRKEYEETGTGIVIGYVGDADPAGESFDVRIEREIRNDHWVHSFALRRIAITFDQVEEYKIKTHDTKTEGNGVKEWIEKYGENHQSADVDEMPSALLTKLVGDFIARHIKDRDEWKRQIGIYIEEKKQLQKFIEGFQGGN